jgi:GNAT superfamily N-acetyltransferase
MVMGYPAHREADVVLRDGSTVRVRPAELDGGRRYGLVATSGGDGRVIGHIGFEREPDRPERAEVAMEVADAMQDKGLGTILLGQVAEAAREAGVQVLGAEVLPQNHQMIKVFRDCGFPVKTHTVPGALLIEFPTSRCPTWTRPSSTATR